MRPIIRLIMSAISLQQIASVIVLPTTPKSWYLLQEFPNHMLIFHFDNDSQDSLPNFFDKSAYLNAKPKTLFNYDTMKKNITRPKGSQFANVIFLRKWGTFRRFSKVFRNIKYEDVLIFVTHHYIPLLNKKFHYDRVEFAKAVFIYVTTTRAIYNVKFYRNDTGLLKQIVPGSDGLAHLNLYLNYFKNFEKFVLDIAYVDCEPFIYNTVRGNVSVVQGVEYVILRLLAATLNFRINLIDFSGVKNHKASMIRAVHNRSVHMAIACLSNSLSRNKLVDFTADIKMEFHAALYSNIGFKGNSFFKIIKPLTVQIWIYLGISIVLIGVAIKRMDFLIGYREADILDYVKIPFRIMVEQSQRFPWNKSPLRILVMSCLMFSLVITNAYKSKLAATLISPLIKEPESFTELLQDNFKFYFPSTDTSFIRERFETSNDSTLMQILDKWNDGRELCDVLNDAFSARIAIIEELSILRYMFWSRCSKQITEKQLASVRLTKYNVLPNNHAWALQQGAPYGKRFSTTLELFHAAGLIDKWYKGFNLTHLIPRSNQFTDYEDKEPLSMDSLLAPFVILLGGLTLATSVLFGEVVYFKKYCTIIPFNW